MQIRVVEDLLAKHDDEGADENKAVVPRWTVPESGRFVPRLSRVPGVWRPRAGSLTRRTRLPGSGA